jgi:ribonucleoside-diphosphate reductase beta chain
MPAPITTKREQYTPFLYPAAYDYFKDQKHKAWEPEDIKWSLDIAQWPTLDPVVREVVAGVLRGFVEAEVLVGDYWSSNVTRWFPHPEIWRMAVQFAAMEGVHAQSYNQLSETLGLDSYAAFKASPDAQRKMEYLAGVQGDSWADRARSLAIFSGFTEGVVLFSSFSILLWLKTPYGGYMMPGITSVIGYSQLDEQLHSKAGCWLFRALLTEDPSLDTPELWLSIYEAAQAVIQLESSFIDSVFTGRSLPGLDPNNLKEYIKYRTNFKLIELGSADRISYDAEAANQIASWFEVSSNAQGNTDFFATQVGNEYATNVFTINPDDFEF